MQCENARFVDYWSSDRGEGRESGAEAIFEEKMVEKFPGLMK